MNNSNKKTGLLALLGLAGGALAWWKYKNLSPEEKARLKAKVNETGTKIKDTFEDAEETISEKLAQLKETVKKEANELNS